MRLFLYSRVESSQKPLLSCSRLGVTLTVSCGLLVGVLWLRVQTAAVLGPTVFISAVFDDGSSSASVLLSFLLKIYAVRA